MHTYATFDVFIVFLTLILIMSALLCQNTTSPGRSSYHNIVLGLETVKSDDENRVSEQVFVADYFDTDSVGR